MYQSEVLTSGCMLQPIAPYTYLQTCIGRCKEMVSRLIQGQWAVIPSQYSVLSNNQRCTDSLVLKLANSPTVRKEYFHVNWELLRQYHELHNSLSGKLYHCHDEVPHLARDPMYFYTSNREPIRVTSISFEVLWLGENILYDESRYHIGHKRWTSEVPFIDGPNLHNTKNLKGKKYTIAEAIGKVLDDKFFPWERVFREDHVGINNHNIKVVGIDTDGWLYLMITDLGASIPKLMRCVHTGEVLL